MIRPIEPGDVAAIAAIYADAVLASTATYETEAPSEAAIAARLARLGQAGMPVLVAAAGDGVLGYAYAAPFRDRAAFRWTVEDSIYLRADARGRGLGARLLEALVDEAARRRFRRMVAVIGEASNAASVRLHEKAGFAQVGRLPGVGWKHGRWLDALLMQRPLGEGDDLPPE